MYPSAMPRDVFVAHICAFLDLHLCCSNDIVSTKIYDKRGDFVFEIVYFRVLDGNDS